MDCRKRYIEDRQLAHFVTVMYVRYENKWFEVTDVVGDGLCLFHALALTMNAPGEGKILRRSLCETVNVTHPKYEDILGCFSVLRKNTVGVDSDPLSVMNFLKGIQNELAAEHVTRECWGSEEHMILHSLVTGNRVICYRPHETGMIEALDTLKKWREIVEAYGAESERLPKIRLTSESKIQYILFHKMGSPECTNHLEHNHFAALEIAFEVPVGSCNEETSFYFSASGTLDRSSKTEFSSPGETGFVLVKGKSKKRHDPGRQDGEAPGGRCKRAKNRDGRKMMKAKRKLVNEESGDSLRKKQENGPREFLDCKLFEQEWWQENSIFYKALKGIAGESDFREERYKKKKIEDRNFADAEFTVGEDLTPEGLRDMLNKDKGGEMMFNDMREEPCKAVLLHYLNSGLFSFQKWKEYRAEFSGKRMSEEEKAELDKEVLDEMLSDEELEMLLGNFFRRHCYNERLLPSCGACGIRAWERPEDPIIHYRKVLLKEPLMEPLKLSSEEEVLLMRLKTIGAVTIPVDDVGNTREVEVWRAKSVYQSKKGTHWHLHPELVDVDEYTCVESTLICPHCQDELGKSRRPELSIASGIDFGCYHRLGLTLPNLHEQLMLARSRLFFAVMKLSSNRKGQVNFNVQNSLKCHAILFPSREAETIPYMMNTDVFGDGGLMDLDYLKGLFGIYCVDEKGEADKLLAHIKGSNEIFGRPHVLAQWILVLRELNYYYSDIDVGNVEDFVTQIGDCIGTVVDMVENDIQVVDDPMAVSHEMALGGDVAQNQQTEIQKATGNSTVDNGAKDLFPQSMKYSYLTSTEHGHYIESKGDGRVGAIKRLLELEKQCDDVKLNGCLMENMALVDKTYGIQAGFSDGEPEEAESREHSLEESEDNSEESEDFSGPVCDGQEKGNKKGNSIKTYRTLYEQRTLQEEPGFPTRLDGTDESETLSISSEESETTNGEKKFDKPRAPTWFDLYPADIPELATAKSSRDAEPVSDFGEGQDHVRNLSTSFPHVFMLGKAYQRHPGRLSRKMRHHLLHQFTLCPATDRRLLAYLFDHKQRISVMDGVKAYVNGKRKSLDTIEALLQDTEKKKELIHACENPYDEGHWKLIKKYMPHLRFASNDVQYGAAEGNKYQWRAMEMNKRFSCPSCFLTISPSNMANPRGVRMSFRTHNNHSFPADFEPGCKFGEDPSDFARRLREHTTLVSEGNIEFPQGYVTRSNRADLAMQNPVAYVQENKTLLWDILSLLIGFNIEDSSYFSKTEGTSNRGTTYYKSKKGIFGHPLYAIGVTENHSRGHLHWHISLLAGIPPDVLQRFANLSGICDSISKVLDQMYQSEVPVEGHVGRIVKDVIKDFKNDKERSVNERVYDCICGSEPLLFTNDHESLVTALRERSKRQSKTQPRGRERGAFGRLFRIMAGIYGSCLQFHSHCSSCFKTHSGESGCRFDFPCGECEKTRGVLLSPAKKERKLSVVSAEKMSKSIDLNIGDDCEGPSYIVTELEQVEDHLFERQEVLRVEHSENVVVWETKRPKIDLSMLTFGEDERIASVHDIKDALLQILKDVPNFEFPRSRNFHRWLTHTATDREIRMLWDEIKNRLPSANQMVPAFNPILSFCTGSHNNASLLGSIDQAKSALFYLVPYQGKSKFPIKETLPVLNAALKYVERHKSQHPTEAGTRTRTVKFLLTRTINKMHLRMEISDYEMVASLLELPSVISTERFAVGNPRALATFGEHVEKREGKQSREKAFEDICRRIQLEEQKKYKVSRSVDFPVFEDEPDEEDAEGLKRKIDDLPIDYGFVRKFTIKGEEDSFILLPDVALYLQRSRLLSHLSYYEYLGCVGVERGNATRKSKSRKRFPLESSFLGCDEIYHVLLQKQRTPLLVGQPPRHPGKKPTLIKPETVSDDANIASTAQLEEWTSKANRYARYYLTLFRPHSMKEDGLSYTWEALEEWVEELRNSDSVLSTFRLMILHQYMKGLFTKNVCKKMTREYRGRNRHMWTAHEKFYQKARERARRQVINEHFVPDDTCMDTHEVLGADVTTNMIKQLEHEIKTRIQMTRFFSGAQSCGKGRQSRNMKSVIGKKVSEQILNKIDCLQSFQEKSAPPCDASKFWECERNRDAARKKIRYLRTRLESKERGIIKNSQQLELFDLYSRHFLHEYEAPCPPPVLLCHGGPGVGKSVIREFICDAATACNRYCFKTSFNAINAVEMGGSTTSSALTLNPEIHNNYVGTFQYSKRTGDKIKDLRACGFDKTSLVIVEEISNQAPWHLARLDRLCKEATRNDEAPFGGALVILIGDLTQLGPVKAVNLSCGVMDVMLSQELRKRLGTKKVKALGKVSLRKGDRPETDKYSFDHPHTIGSKLFTHSSVRWFELTEQQRSLDEEHTKFVTGNYRGRRIMISSLKENYRRLTSQDATDLSWIKAPILVCTNRERQTLTHTRSIQFAMATGRVVIRWKTNSYNWKQKPSLPEHQKKAQEDPCFYEYFVEGADAFLTENIQKDLKLTNATAAVYHSLVLDEYCQAELDMRLSEAQPGQVITLNEPPHAVNMEIKVENKISSRQALKALRSSQVGKVKYTPRDRNSSVFVVPVWKYKCKRDSSETTVRGGEGFYPSKVTLQKVFPIEPAFAITVHKSEGRTMSKVIIALSRCMAKGCDFSYAQVHVAFSRVRRGNDIRLLLTGDDEVEQWRSVLYLSRLQPKPSIKYYFDGFRQIENYEEPNNGWRDNKWDGDKANEAYKDVLVDEIRQKNLAKTKRKLPRGIICKRKWS